MKKFPVAVLFAAVLASGCVTWQAPPSTASYGHAPVNYESRARAYMETVLKDAMSAQYRFEQPVRAYSNIGWGQPNGGQVEWTGYLVKAYVNAKNSYGAYTGYRPYMFLFKDDAVFQVIPGGEHPLVHVVQ